ncbi:hypothetical protein [Clostridium sp. C2-6-12]|uniref:hypothetical protein n=1 Tax=Clostridium sp. C2-6-12 TaxID=2698832 RepID=UPI00136D8161|nr:hypothetical protein [Clostridium sp. C2-6-12]
MNENTIKVYVQVNSNNIITSINSSIFISDLTDWILIDEGYGDKYSHAQGNYLDKYLIDLQGKYNYKLVDNKPVEMTDEEKRKLFPVPVRQLTLEERVAMIENLQLQKEGVI